MSTKISGRARAFLLAMSLAAVATVPAAADERVRTSDPRTFAERYYAPMRFMLGRLPTTPPCGLDCVDFVVGEGIISPLSSFQYLLATRKLGERRPPLLLDSPGGMRMGMKPLADVWKAAGLTIVIARAREVPCGGADRPACVPADTAAGVKVFEVSSGHGACESACPFTILGAPRRVVPADAKIGLHSPHLDPSNPAFRFMREVNPDFKLEGVVDLERDMASFATFYGASPAMAKRALATPGHKIDYLAPADIVAFGIATTALEAAGLSPALLEALTRKHAVPR